MSVLLRLKRCYLQRMNEASEETNVSNKSININKPLRDFTYKELQNVCMVFNLPANIKHARMLAMLEAYQQGDGGTLQRIIDEYREQRCRPRTNRPLSLVMETRLEDSEPKPKRRKLNKPKCKGQYGFPQVSKENGMLTSSVSLISRNSSRGVTGDISRTTSNNIENSGETSGLTTMKLVMEATAARRDSTMYEPALHSTQPMLRTLLHDTQLPRSLMHGLQLPGLNGTAIPYGYSASDTNTHMSQNHMTHPTWNPQVEFRGSEIFAPYLPDANTRPMYQTPVASIFDTGTSTSRLHELKEANNYEEKQNAHDLTTDRRPVLQPSFNHTPNPFVLPPQQTHTFLPERQFQSCLYESSPAEHQSILPDIVEQDYYQSSQREELSSTNSKKLTTSLERVLNMKSECLSDATAMPKFWKSANTSIYQCYSAPLCSPLPTWCSTTPEEENSNGPTGSTSRSGIEHKQIMGSEQSGAIGEPWWRQENQANQIQQPPPIFPEFRQNNQLSYPLIYSYLASTEEQLKQQHNQDQRENMNTDLFSDIQHCPQAMSSPVQTTSTFPARTLILPDVPQLDDAMLDIINDEHRGEEEQEYQYQQQLQQQKFLRKKKGKKFKHEICQYRLQGCMKKYLDQDELQQHEMMCEFQTVSCYNSCEWRGRLKYLAMHLREVHRGDILSKAEASHDIPLHDVRARQKISFLREVNRRLFIICVHCHGHLLYATVQYVPSWKPHKVSLVKASLEVVGSDGKPYAWRGKVRPVYEPLSTLWATEQCLTIDPAALGAFAGATIILHTNITTYIAGSKKKSNS